MRESESPAPSRRRRRCDARAAQGAPERAPQARVAPGAGM